MIIIYLFFRRNSEKVRKKKWFGVNVLLAKYVTADCSLTDGIIATKINKHLKAMYNTRNNLVRIKYLKFSRISCKGKRYGMIKRCWWNIFRSTALTTSDVIEQRGLSRERRHSSCHLLKRSERPQPILSNAPLNVTNENNIAWPFSRADTAKVYKG